METLKRALVAVCPACKFLGNEQVLVSKKTFKCPSCEEKLKQPLTAQQYRLASTFAIHNKRGYKCLDCKRFIPHPLDYSQKITCPYIDCLFVGNLDQLTRMSHPMMTLKLKSVKDNQISIVNPKPDNLSILISIVDSQINSAYYDGINATRIHYISVYEAFKNLIDRYPDEMLSYLVDSDRGNGLQHKIFQEYIRILENKLPFGFKKNKKSFKISSLLDENLSIFDGISNFDSVVTDKRIIKNNTQELYIGGRTGAYTKPFYIGKLLDIINKDTDKTILSDVKEYSFSQIILKDTPPQTNVSVIHLRIPPHYQMGGMSYVNRARKKIVDKVCREIRNSKREVKNET